MKNYTIILLFLFTHLQASVAQSHYDYWLYSTSQRTETGFIRSICPCEEVDFFSGRQDKIGHRPMIVSQNCPP